MSGQGPYWETAGWFNVLHPEKLPSAIERYNNFQEYEAKIAAGEDTSPKQ
ncbi:hypothetical protein B0H66DRAFT_599909 [Apodospora peruviana]|uniref:Uncharacterized protein n=1 Tax=Apodospora peruviana TaxID=516989 RepID=A0AAE0IIL8_9PEZI|nr:hypothetical protein B0H66DRAFT_599909 [Apodospora peruviana]